MTNTKTKEKVNKKIIFAPPVHMVLRQPCLGRNSCKVDTFKYLLSLAHFSLLFNLLELVFSNDLLHL